MFDFLVSNMTDDDALDGEGEGGVARGLGSLGGPGTPPPSVVGGTTSGSVTLGDGVGGGVGLGVGAGVGVKDPPVASTSRCFLFLLIASLRPEDIADARLALLDMLLISVVNLFTSSWNNVVCSFARVSASCSSFHAFLTNDVWVFSSVSTLEQIFDSVLTVEP